MRYQRAPLLIHCRPTRPANLFFFPLSLQRTLAELATKARNDAIAIEDMAGGSFTVSNGGVFGSLMGTPIINPPQSAILGMHATKMRPMAINVSTHT